MMHRLCLLFSILLLCYLPLSIRASEASLGPPRARRPSSSSFKQRYAFNWKASVDTNSGIALSKETMHAQPASALARHFRQPKQGEDAWSDVVERLEGYPEWLARGAVTFGVFQAVPLVGGGFSLRDRIFGMHLLAFGTPQTQRFSFLRPTTTQPVTQDTLDNDTAGRQVLQPTIRICTVTIPILGGWLALCKDSSNNHNNYCERPNMGCLKFTLKHNEALGETQLVTEIRGFSPRLLGGKEPVPWYRKCLYLSTQSILHAYVMWRFQRYCIHGRYGQEEDDKRLASVEGFASYATTPAEGEGSSDDQATNNYGQTDYE